MITGGLLQLVAFGAGALSLDHRHDKGELSSGHAVTAPSNRKA
jgi:hypothetical protein